ncbi:MAG: hypothetical protein J6K21_03370 [Bacilli bacterium]|nr:hypothetical protein [Bacilli bacterium]
MTNVERMEELEKTKEKTYEIIREKTKNKEQRKKVFRKEYKKNVLLTIISLLTMLGLSTIPELVLPFILFSLVSDYMIFFTLYSEYKNNQRIKKIEDDHKRDIDFSKRYLNDLSDELEIRKILEEKEKSNIITENEIIRINQIINDNEKLIHNFSIDDLKILSNYLKNNKIDKKLEKKYDEKKYNQRCELLKNIRNQLIKIKDTDCLKKVEENINSYSKLKKIKK